MNKSKNIKLVYLFCVTLITVCSCGDIFLKRRKIVGNYYLVEQEGISEYSIGYKLNGGAYIGRVPAPVVEYGWTDSILVARSMQDTIGLIYIINMKKDFKYAEQWDYIIDTLNYEEFDTKWQKVLKIKFKKV